MPTSKTRTTKRPSSSSFVSTISTAVFIALCVLGIWMLTTNSVVPTQTTSRTSTTTTETGLASSNEAQTVVKSEEKKDAPIYEDNPGDLPEDAIKSDDHGNTNGDEKPKEEQKSEGSTVTAAELESNSGDKQESEHENGGGDGKNEEDKGKEQVPIVEENRDDSQGKQLEKPTESEEQVSEESSLTQTQKVEEITQKNSESEQTQQTSDGSGNENQEVKQNERQEQNSVPETGENSNQAQNQKPNEISEEDQQQRVQQQQEEKQNQEQQPQQQNSSQIEFPDVTTTESEKNQKPQTTETVSNEQELQPVTTDQAKSLIKNEEIQQATNPETIKEDNNNATDSNSEETFPAVKNTGIPKESKESKKSWSTQAAQSENQKERQTDGKESHYGYEWLLCNVTAGPDYIPCLDNEKAIKQLRTTKHFEHRERHCPEEAQTCLVPLPQGYKIPVEWPHSRDKIWYHNVPHTKLAEVKGHQNWVKVTGEFLTFPGGGTQFIHGALHYIQFLEKAVPDIAWGKHTRVILDVGCGVASFGGYLFEKDVLTMSFAPKDEHEAQVQFALERGIPAISAVMGSQRLPFPSRVFDLVHCARCRVPWHAEGGALLVELNRVLRPGGYFVWSATPVYQKLEEDVEIWNAMSALTISMCWELITIKKDKLNSVGAAIYRKPSSNGCYDQRKKKSPPMCKNDDDPNAAWYVPLQSCMHMVPVDDAERGSRWPENWPSRLAAAPYWLNSSQMGIYGKPAPQDFETDYKHWKQVVDKLYMTGLGISWSNVRNVMDMRAVYGGFAAALKDLKVWVFNVVNTDSPDTLPIIYERGLFGIYHDWCESFSSYPRTYDLLHADHLLSRLKKRCKIAPVMAEIDRLVRPGGKLIVRDESGTVGEIENLLKSLQWEVHLTFSKDQEGILSAQKSFWRPELFAASS